MTTTALSDANDDECQQMTSEKNVARSRMLVTGVQLNRERYQAIRGEKKCLYRSKKRQHELSVIAVSKKALKAMICGGFMQLSMTRDTRLW